MGWGGRGGGGDRAGLGPLRGPCHVHLSKGPTKIQLKNAGCLQISVNQLLCNCVILQISVLQLLCNFVIVYCLLIKLF